MPAAVCPECDEKIHVNADVDQGDVIICDECETELEVVGLDPIELDPYYGDEIEEYDDDYDIFDDDLEM